VLWPGGGPFGLSKFRLRAPAIVFLGVLVTFSGPSPKKSWTRGLPAIDFSLTLIYLMRQQAGAEGGSEDSGIKGKITMVQPELVRAATQGKDFMAVRKILILWLLGWMWLSPVIPALAQGAAPSQAKPQILEFSRKLCPDCVKSQRVVQVVQNQYPGRFVVRNFYLEEQAALFRRYKVAIVPSQVFLDPRGQKVYQHEGPFKPAELIKKLRELKFIR
jgi:hypothetical protein